MQFESEVNTLKKLGFVILCLIFSLVLIGPKAETQNINFIAKETLISKLDLESNVQIIEKRAVDITGDQIKDQVFLIGQKPAGDSSLFYAPIKVIVYDIYNKEYYINSYDNFSGYEPKLAFYDFTNDQTKDIFVKTNSGGSGGIYHHLIASFMDNELKIIFDNQNNKPLHVSGNYEDGFQAVLNIPELNERFKLDLSFNRRKYIEENIYTSDGNLLRDVKPYTYPLSQLTPVDYDFDESFELRGIQRVVGAYGADSIAHLTTVLKYEGSWQIKQVEISTYLKKYNPEYSENNNINYQIKQNTITSGTKEIYYPQINNLPEDVNSIYINHQLKEMVKPFFNEESELYIDYEFTRQEKDLISIKYSGYQKHEDGQYEILKSFNYDLKNNRLLTPDNILKEGNNIKEKVDQIIKKNIQNQSLQESFPGLKDWMGFFITDHELILYYLKDDFETEFKKIRVPLSELRPYLSFKLNIKNNETEIFIIEVD